MPAFQTTIGALLLCACATLAQVPPVKTTYVTINGQKLAGTFFHAKRVVQIFRDPFEPAATPDVSPGLPPLRRGSSLIRSG